MLVEPQRLFDRALVSPDEVVRHLHGFDLPRLSGGDPAGLASSRLIHKREALLDLSLRAGEADLVFSVSLLEHLPVDDALETLRRITKPGGLGVHVLDLVDHRFYGGDAASPFAFLTEPPSDALVHGSNRLRSHEWCAKFAAHGFTVERVEEWSNQPAPTGGGAGGLRRTVSLADARAADGHGSAAVRPPRGGTRRANGAPDSAGGGAGGAAVTRRRRGRRHRVASGAAGVSGAGGHGGWSPRRRLRRARPAARHDARRW